jgi:DNA repair protein RecO (recombination protein O)
LFGFYERTLQRMSAGETLAWTLRRFERDMLDSLGYALQLDVDALDGEPLDPASTYFYDPESGAMPGRAGDPRSIRGADLLALAEDRSPDTAGLASLRRMMRQVIAFHLGGGELKAWRVLR